MQIASISAQRQKIAADKDAALVAAINDHALSEQIKAEERAALVAQEARAYVRRHRLRRGDEDAERVVLFGVDVQVAFCLPGASLFVPGAVEDNQRALAWLYRHLDRVTELVFTLDTHHAHQLFHPSWWTDAEGLPPPPLTSITAAEVRAGRWRAVREPEASLAYLEQLMFGPPQVVLARKTTDTGASVVIFAKAAAAVEQGITMVREVVGLGIDAHQRIGALLSRGARLNLDV